MTAKYVLTQSGVRNPDRVNDWFAHCRVKKIPYITIENRTKFATVEWDYISLPTELDELIRNNQQQLLEGFRAIYLKYANVKSEGRLNSHVPRFINIEVGKAEELASELYDFVSNVLGLLSEAHA